MNPAKPIFPLSTTPPEALAGYPVLIELPVQWGDQDAFGHVNNVVFFRWIESSRIAYAQRVGLLPHRQNPLGDGPESETNSKNSQPNPADNKTMPTANGGLILAAVSCNYRQQVSYPDSLVIGARTSRIGNSSLTMEHLLYSQTQQAVVADGQATVVFFDYAQNKSRPLPQRIRQAIAALEPK